MDDIFNSPKKKPLINPVFIGGAIFGIVVIGIVIWVLAQKPSMEIQTARILEGSFQEGSPEFSQLTKDIIISNDNTIQSPMATGTISMFINGKVRNKGTSTIDALEINVSVVTQFDQVLKEKRMLVVPTQVPQLGPGETIDVHTALEGFAKDDDRANIRWKVTAIRLEK